MKWFIKCMKHYADFSGRARRMEYWMFVLCCVVLLIPATVLDNVLGLQVADGTVGIFYCLTALALFIPSIAVAVRRLHDTGRTGWWYLICLVPLIGGIWLLVLMLLEGQQGENKYGPDPKAVEA